MNEFEGKVSIVTGAARGIGRVIAERLLADGATVVGLDLGPKDGVTFEHGGDRFDYRQGDVSDRKSIQEVFDEVIEHHGHVDHLVCNAGVTRDQLLIKMSDEEWSRVIDVNLTGTYNCIRALTRHFIKRRAGAIVALSSVIGQTGNTGQANYAASKAGIIALCRSVAKELGGRGIRANAIAPGYIETEMTGKLPEKLRKAYLERIPLRRPGTSTDVADGVCFLLSDRASYITGQVIHVNGGLYP